MKDFKIIEEYYARIKKIINQIKLYRERICLTKGWQINYYLLLLSQLEIKRGEEGLTSRLR